MIPVERLAVKHKRDEDGEYRQRNDLLDYFQLKQAERPAVSREADAVRRHGEAVFEKGYAPGKKYDQYERPARGDFHLLELKMPIPRESHKDIR